MHAVKVTQEGYTGTDFMVQVKQRMKWWDCGRVYVGGKGQEREVDVRGGTGENVWVCSEEGQRGRINTTLTWVSEIVKF